MCALCEHQSTTKHGIKKHKEQIHEGVKYAWTLCKYEATTKGSLNKHKRSIHEGIKYGTAYLLAQFYTRFGLLTNRTITWFKQLSVQTNRKRESKFRCSGKYHLPLNTCAVSLILELLSLIA